MKRHQVYALSKDTYWLKALAGIAGEDITVQPILCPTIYPEYLDRLPEAEPGALFLVDATGQPDVADTVRRLWELGWRYVVIVAADPSWRETHAVLREAGGYDYWRKSYETAIIRRNVGECLAQMEQEVKP